MSDKIQSQVTTTVQNVSSRLVSNGTRTIWDVHTPDGTKWSTFKAEIGNAAMALIGQQADLQVEISKNGDFTNYTLVAIRPGTGSVTTPAGQAAVQAAATQTQAPQVSYGEYKSLEEDKERRKNQSIHRQVAAKVSAALGPEGVAEFWANVEALVVWFETGVTPFQQKQDIVTNGTENHVKTPSYDPGPTEPDWVGAGPQEDPIPF